MMQLLVYFQNLSSSPSLVASSGNWSCEVAIKFNLFSSGKKMISRFYTFWSNTRQTTIKMSCIITWFYYTTSIVCTTCSSPHKCNSNWSGLYPVQLGKPTDHEFGCGGIIMLLWKFSEFIILFSVRLLLWVSESLWPLFFTYSMVS